MSDLLRVRWTIIPQISPRPWLNCNRCGTFTPFKSSGRIRLNANGKRLDAWLIYRCTSCDNSWNRPVLERRPIRSVDPQLLAALQANDPGLAHRLAFDLEGLRRCTRRVETFDDVFVSKEVMSRPAGVAESMEVFIAAAEPTGIRLDRLLAAELGLPRNGMRELLEQGDLLILPGGVRMLRRPVRSGTRLTFLRSDLLDKMMCDE
jgi:hypothetical protein